MSTQLDQSSGAAETQQKELARRRAYAIIWANVIVVAGFLIYMMWFWHADPVSWPWWVLRLTCTFFVFSGIHRILAKTFDE